MEWDEANDNPRAKAGWVPQPGYFGTEHSPGQERDERAEIAILNACFESTEEV